MIEVLYCTDIEVVMKNAERRLSPTFKRAKTGSRATKNSRSISTILCLQLILIVLSSSVSTSAFSHLSLSKAMTPGISR
jgi:hypothetical protein